MIALCSAPALAADAPASLFGKYAGMGCARDDLTCVPTRPSDWVRIAHGPQQPKVSLRIQYDRGHSCSLEGNATWAPGRLTLDADGITPDQPCELTLEFTGNVLRLKDADQRCRAVYCGARGTLEGAQFKRR